MMSAGQMPIGRNRGLALSDPTITVLDLEWAMRVIAKQLQQGPALESEHWRAKLEAQLADLGREIRQREVDRASYAA